MDYQQQLQHKQYIQTTREASKVVYYQQRHQCDIYWKKKDYLYLIRTNFFININSRWLLYQSSVTCLFTVDQSFDRILFSKKWSISLQASKLKNTQYLKRNFMSARGIKIFYRYSLCMRCNRQQVNHNFCNGNGQRDFIYK